MPHVVITGSQGFVGLHAITMFRRAGWRVTPVGRRPNNDPDYVQQDLSTPFSSLLEERVADSDVVIHAAARSSPWGSRREFVRDNVSATRNVVEACRRNGKPRLIFISSSSVYYRSADQLNIVEQVPLASPAVNVYAETKQLGEQLTRAYEGSWAILRPRAVFGPGDTVLFPRILKAASAGTLPLLIRRSGPVVGDLIYVENLAHYLLKAAEDPSAIGDFNLTDNCPVQIVEFLLEVFDQLNIPRPHRELPVQLAHYCAMLLELLYRGLALKHEPPITRFGVHVFSWSKTFNVKKMIDTFGPPPITTSDGMRRFVRWIQEKNPYS